MVEGDLVDLTLPSLLQAVLREHSTALLRVQHGTDLGELYFSEGALIHALTGESVGDEAVYEILRWSDGRFRLARNADQRPRTVSQQLANVLASAEPGRSNSHSSSNGSARQDESADERLLTELLTLLARLEQDRVRLEEGQGECGGVPALLLVTAAVNSLIAFVTARCGDLDVLPSRVLSRLADTQPYTQLLGEETDRISVATAAGVLKTWNTCKEDRQQLFLELCRALLDVLTMYGNTASTFFHSSREREEWRATFGVFVDGMWTAVQQVEA